MNIVFGSNGALGNELFQAFLENDKTTKTGLSGLLESIGIERVYLCGLATDFCVKWSALDATDFGFETILLHVAIRRRGPKFYQKNGAVILAVSA